MKTTIEKIVENGRTNVEIKMEEILVKKNQVRYFYFKKEIKLPQFPARTEGEFKKIEEFYNNYPNGHFGIVLAAVIKDAVTNTVKVGFCFIRPRWRLDKESKRFFRSIAHGRAKKHGIEVPFNGSSRNIAACVFNTMDKSRVPNCLRRMRINTDAEVEGLLLADN